MKTIKTMEIIIDPLTMYKQTKTPAQRALAGYIMKSGNAYDSIFGGAFHLLRQVERYMELKEIYYIMPCSGAESIKQIVHIAQSAIDGDLDQFAMTEKEIANTIKYLQEMQ